MGILGLFGWGKAAAQAARLMGPAKKLKEFLSNQIDDLHSLQAAGTPVFINEVSVAYLLHVFMLIERKPINLSDAQLAIQHAFQDTDWLPWIDNAFEIVEGDAEFETKLAALFPIAKKEFDAGSGDFLVRYILKETEERATLDPGRDLRLEPAWNASRLP